LRFSRQLSAMLTWLERTVDKQLDPSAVLELNTKRIDLKTVRHSASTRQRSPSSVLNFSSLWSRHQVLRQSTSLQRVSQIRLQVLNSNLRFTIRALWAKLCSVTQSKPTPIRVAQIVVLWPRKGANEPNQASKISRKFLARTSTSSWRTLNGTSQTSKRSETAKIQILDTPLRKCPRRDQQMIAKCKDEN